MRNYLGYVKSGCLLVGASTMVGLAYVAHRAWGGRAACAFQVFDSPALVKAKASVDKNQLFTRREPLWLQRRACLQYPHMCFVASA